MAINYPVVFKVDKSGLTDAESSLKKFGGIMAGVAAGVTAAVGGIAVVSVNEFAKFDAALTKSMSIMGDLSDEMKTTMSDAAREVAKTTTFSAEQAAESYYFLASAGLDAASAVEAMPAVAQFAQAGMFDMALATDLLTDAQSALGLTIRDDAVANMENMVRVSDTLSRASQLANASIEQFSISLTTKAGTALKTVGKDVEEGAAALAVFADQGVKGEIAGTQLTNTIFGLSDRANAVPEKFEALGISVFDSAGQMRNFADIADDFNGAMSDMSTEQKLATLSQLGFTKQARNGLLLLMENGEALRTYENELRNAGGTTEEVAEKQLESFSAQLGLLKASFTDLAIEIGGPIAEGLSGLMADFRPLVDMMLPKIRDFMEKYITPGFTKAGEAFSVFSNALQAGGTMGDIFDKVFANLQGWIEGGGISEMLNKMLDFRQQLFQTIMDALPGILEAFIAFLPTLLTFVTDTLLPSLIEQFTLLVNDLVELFVTLVPMLIGAIAELAPQLAAAIGEMAPKLVQALVQLIPTLLDTAIEVFMALVDAVIVIIPQLIATFLDMFPRVLQAILDQLPKIIESALELFDGLITAFLDILPMLIDAIVEAIPQIVGAIVDALPQLIDGAIQLFLGLLDGLLEALPQLLDELKELIPTLVRTLLDLLPDFIDGTLELWLGIVSGLVQATPEILEAIIELIPVIVDELLAALPRLVDAGFRLISGLAKGMIENAPRILGDAAREIGNGLVNKFKDVFQIKSPSRVFEGIGDELVAGLGKGLEDGEKLLEDTSLQLGSSVSIAAADGLAMASMATPVPSAQYSNGNTTNVTYSISVNAGMGTDGNRVGQMIVDEIIKFERTSGRVFARA